jgi:hypothetical protein
MLTTSGLLLYMVVYPTVLTNTETDWTVIVDRIGTVTNVIAMHVPSGHSITVEVEVLEPTVVTEDDRTVVVMVDKMGFVAIGTLAARTSARMYKRGHSHRIAGVIGGRSSQYLQCWSRREKNVGQHTVHIWRSASSAPPHSSLPTSRAGR